MLAATLVASTSVVGCDAANSDTSRLRVENASKVSFSSVVVGSETDPVSFGAVGAGSASDYYEVASVTESDNVEALANGQAYRVMPVHDGYGAHMKPGRYTYVLDIEDGRLTLRLKKD